VKVGYRKIPANYLRVGDQVICVTRESPKSVEDLVHPKSKDSEEVVNVNKLEHHENFVIVNRSIRFRLERMVTVVFATTTSGEW
jgi:hypothetical protein